MSNKDMNVDVMNNFSSRKLWRLINLEKNIPSDIKQRAQQVLDKRCYR